MVRAAAAALNGTVPDNLPVITRPRDGAMVAGVCAGLARRWHVDPNLLRIAVVVLTVFGGLGAVAYGCGLLLMPRDGKSVAPVRRLLPFTRTWSTGAVVAITVVTAVVIVAISGFNGIGLGPLLVILAIWFFGFRGRGSHKPVAPPPEPTPFERAAENWRQRLVEQQTPGYERVPAVAPAEPRWTQPYTEPAGELVVRDDDLPAPVVAPARPQHRWRLWWLALSLVGVAVLVVTLLGYAGLPTPPLAYAAAVLAGLGATLVVSARRGRPPLLLPATVLTAATTAWLLLVPYSAAATVGDVTATYSGDTAPPSVVTRAAGDVTLDLGGLTPSADENLMINVGAGDVTVTLPAHTVTNVTYKVGLGDISIDGAQAAARDHSGSASLTGSAASPGDPILHLTIAIGAGDLRLEQP